jgi:hypothetical protein
MNIVAVDVRSAIVMDRAPFALMFGLILAVGLQTAGTVAWGLTPGC